MIPNVQPDAPKLAGDDLNMYVSTLAKIPLNRYVQKNLEGPKMMSAIGPI